MTDYSDPEPTLVVRLHPVGATGVDVVRQFHDHLRPGSPRISLMRTVPEDPGAIALESLGVVEAIDPAKVANDWAAAQLAADSTFLGLALGLRVVLVAESGRWYADTLVVRTGARLRGGRGWIAPERALRSVQRSYRASHLDAGRKPRLVSVPR